MLSEVTPEVTRMAGNARLWQRGSWYVAGTVEETSSGRSARER